MSIKQVSTVDFRKNIYKYINDLPIAVTRKGETAFYVVKQLSTHDVSTVHPAGVKSVDVSTLQPHPTYDYMKKEVEKDEKELRKFNRSFNKSNYIKKPKSAKIPMFCPKHQGSRIGNNYTCGCEI
jgi:hypothetical protein